MATDSSASATPNQEVPESGDFLPIGSESESCSAYREWICNSPEAMTGWITYMEAFQKEVREGRSPEGFLLDA